MHVRFASVALALLLVGCSSERLTGVAAEQAAKQYQAQVIAPSDEPMYFLDGKEITPAAAREMDVSTIESVEVVKGAAATKLYGERGSRGVILITRKTASLPPAPGAR
jgi:TonB-dependent SusC/RagA subfamily outer membrane receptor